MPKPLVGVIKEHLASRVQNNELSNQDLIEVIDLLGRYLNAETISNYAKREGISYNGALKRNLKHFELFGVKFVIDNE